MSNADAKQKDDFFKKYREEIQATKIEFSKLKMNTDKKIGDLTLENNFLDEKIKEATHVHEMNEYKIQTLKNKIIGLVEENNLLRDELVLLEKQRENKIKVTEYEERRQKRYEAFVAANGGVHDDQWWYLN